MSCDLTSLCHVGGRLTAQAGRGELGLRVLAAHGDGRKLLVLPLDNGHRCKLLRRLQLETDVWEVEVGRLVADLGEGWEGRGPLWRNCNVYFNVLYHNMLHTLRLLPCYIKKEVDQSLLQGAARHI